MNSVRAALHTAVDQIFDRLAVTPDSTEDERGPVDRASDGDDPEGARPGTLAQVKKVGEAPDFDYFWPTYAEPEHFERAAIYRVRGPRGTVESIIAWTRREAWGKDRGRAVVFEHVGTSPKNWYPWVEFVETDDGRYAAPLPDPDHPRGMLRDGSPLPLGYDTFEVARTDELFGSVRHGPSLRVVLDADYVERMVQHGYEVARRRRRLG
jgi:hypothetical protein